MQASEICKRATIRLTELTGNPLASIICQNAYGEANRLGRTLAAISDQQLVGEYSIKLMSAWPDNEIEAVCDKPEFIMALCSLLCQSITAYIVRITGGR
jgi:hypothetical protein